MYSINLDDLTNLQVYRADEAGNLYDSENNAMEIMMLYSVQSIFKFRWFQQLEYLKAEFVLSNFSL